MKSKLQFKHIYVTYNKVDAVHDLNLEINSGELFVLVGASGCGKTTTLKMVNRLQTPTKGQILYKNQDISKFPLRKMRQNIGYVFQNIALFPNMTILENAAIQLRAKNVSLSKAKPIVTRLMQKVGLDPKTYLNRMPSELSGGQQQRVGIVRALAADPDTILMDEPFSALDPISREKLQDLVLNLYRELHKTIIFVTHDMNEAIRLGTRIGVMEHGHLLQVGTADDIVTHPANKTVAAMFHNQRSANIADMIAGGFYRLVDHPNDQQYICVDKGISIPQLAEKLKSNPIIFEGKYLITTKDLLSFISEN